MKPGWQKVKFGDVVRLNTDRCANPAAEGIERYVGLEHIDPDDLRIRRWGSVAEGTTFTNLFKPGHVLFGKRRAYQRKVAVADFSGVCSGDIYVFEPKGDRLLPELLPFLCQTESFFEYAVGTSAGSLSPRTNWSQLAGFEFALPPLQEQCRIVRLLASYLSSATSYQTALEQLRSLSRSLLVYLLDRHTHVSTAIRTRITELGNPREPVMRTGPFGSRLKTSFFRSTGIPIITIGSLGEDGLSPEEFFFLDPEYENEFAEYQTRYGDIVFSRVADVGRCHLIRPEEAGYVISSNLIRIRVAESLVQPEFLWLMLKYSLDLRKEIRRITTQAAGRLLVNTQTMESLHLRIPEPAYQRHVVAQYRELESSISHLSSRLNVTGGALRSIRENILMGS